jgi:chromosome segregation ATPase
MPSFIATLIRELKDKRKVEKDYTIKKLEQKIADLEGWVDIWSRKAKEYEKDIRKEWAEKAILRDKLDELRNEIEELQKKLNKANETLVLLSSVLPEDILAERLKHLQKYEEDL